MARNQNIDFHITRIRKSRGKKKTIFGTSIYVIPKKSVISLTQKRDSCNYFHYFHVFPREFWIFKHQLAIVMLIRVWIWFFFYRSCQLLGAVWNIQVIHFLQTCAEIKTNFEANFLREVITICQLHAERDFNTKASFLLPLPIYGQRSGTVFPTPQKKISSVCRWLVSEFINTRAISFEARL